MPYRRRYRRKRRFRTSKWKQYLYTMRKLSGMRKFLKENRDGSLSFETQLDRVDLRTMGCMGCQANDEVYVDAAYGQTGVGLGEQGGDNDELNDVSANVVQKFYIYGEKHIYHFKNQSEVAAFITIYECIAKRDADCSGDSTTNSPEKICMHDIIMGLKDYYGASNPVGGPIGTTVDVQGDGILDDDDGYSPGDTQVDAVSKFVAPTQSSQFKAKWRVLKKKLYKLPPGGEIFWKVHVKNHVYNPQNERARGGSGPDDRVVRRNLTKTLVIKTHGGIGTLSDDVSVQGLMRVGISIDLVVAARVIPLRRGEPSISHQVLKDADNDQTALFEPGNAEDNPDQG